MMQSPTTQVKRLEDDVHRVLRGFDLRALSSKQRDVLADLTQVLIDARVYCHSYELSETREEQIKNAKLAHKWLRRARKNILSASEFDVFGAVDVAQLTAEIEQLIDNLK